MRTISAASRSAMLTRWRGTSPHIAEPPPAGAGGEPGDRGIGVSRRRRWRSARGISRGAEKREARIGYRRIGEAPVVSYADKSGGSQGSRSEVRSQQPAPGKQTLVEQIVAPVVQQRAADSHDPSDAAAVHAAASRGVATPASPL